MANRLVPLSFGLALLLSIDDPGLAVTPYSDRLTDIEHSLVARGYRGPLASKEHAVGKILPNGSQFSVVLWMKSPAGTRLRDARQIKFTQSYCNIPGFQKMRFFPAAKAERDAFFRDVIGQASPAGLDADIPAIGYDDTRYYAVSHFRKVRLIHRPMKCDIRGGEAYELDFFP